MKMHSAILISLISLFLLFMLGCAKKIEREEVYKSAPIKKLAKRVKRLEDEVATLKAQQEPSPAPIPLETSEGWQQADTVDSFFTQYWTEREQLARKGEIVPIPEGTNCEFFKQRAEKFFEALIDKDFERAYAIAFDRIEWVEQSDQYSNVVRIVTIGEPFRRKGLRYADGKGVHVPFEVELADGRIRRAFINLRCDKGYVNMRSKELGIDIPEGEWVFDGGL